MKNLANCTPREFFVQSVKIRHAVENWLSVTDILNIRKTAPHLEADVSDAERRAAYKKQAQDNAWAMFDSIVEQHPDESLELLALMNFVDPKDVDSHTMSEYLASLAELISNENVLSFFYSLTRLGQMASRR